MTVVAAIEAAEEVVAVNEIDDFLLGCVSWLLAYLLMLVLESRKTSLCCYTEWLPRFWLIWVSTEDFGGDVDLDKKKCKKDCKQGWQTEG
jgi:hypothetical protein